MTRTRILKERPYLHMRGYKMLITEDDTQAAQVKPNGIKPPAALCHWVIFCLHGIPTGRDAHANTSKVRALAIHEMQNWLAHLPYAFGSSDNRYSIFHRRFGINFNDVGWALILL